MIKELPLPPLLPKASRGARVNAQRKRQNLLQKRQGRKKLPPCPSIAADIATPALSRFLPRRRAKRDSIFNMPSTTMPNCSYVHMKNKVGNYWYVIVATFTTKHPRNYYSTL